MDVLLGIFSAFGLSASAGLNAYIPLLVVGVVAHYFPNMLTLNSPWNTLANPWILILLGILVIVEMLADKVPAVNHVNDLIQTVVRPAAGAIAFAASAQSVRWSQQLPAARGTCPSVSRKILFQRSYLSLRSLSLS